MSAKTWFITGTSCRFAREWVLAALERGDSVAATIATADYESLLATWNEWQPLAVAAHGRHG